MASKCNASPKHPQREKQGRQEPNPSWSGRLAELRSRKAVKAVVAKAGDIRAVDLVQLDITADRPNQLWIAEQESWI